MYENRKFLAIIPARGGSKGIPRKNLILVHNKPLIQYTIEAALNSKYLDDIIVSTDNIEIANVSKSLGAKVPYLRPSNIATDNSKTIFSIIHVIEKQKELGFEYDYVVILQPTQPLRKSRHIDEAIKKIILLNSENLVSVSKVKEHPILMRSINNQGLLENHMQLNSTVRRQDFPDIYKVNGAIYINKVSTINRNTSLNDNKLPYIMDSKDDLDIDESYDIDLLKWILSKSM